MADVKVVVDGDVIIYNVGEDSDLAEYVAEICQNSPNAEGAEVV